mmetsp:Transcript_25235/g.80189  ORF Transcript_25235/g.80189 Transcript_25235/m.80189 type:complete len:533 (-) Transcript_25235:661-2259(-)
MRTDALCPVLVAVLDVPLVTERHDALVAGARDNWRLGLKVALGSAVGQHVLLDLLLHVHDLLTRVRPHREHAGVEALHVHLFLCCRKLVLLLVRVDLQLLTDVGRRSLPKLGLRDLQNLDDVVGHAPLLLHTKLLPPVVTRLPVVEARKVVRSLGRNAGDDAGALLHGYREHGKGKDCLVGRKGRAERQTHQVLAGLLQKHDRLLLPRLGLLHLPQALVAHVQGRPLRADEDLAPAHPEEAVLALGKHKAVGLPVHSLRPQCGGHQEDLRLPQSLGPLSGDLEDLQLDERVLHRLHALAFGPVVVGTRLVCGNGEDALAFPIVQVLFPQLLELPADEGVIVRVHVRGDEGAPPVHGYAKPFQVLHRQRWKVLQPVLRFRELWDLLLVDAKGNHDVVLVEAPRLGLHLGLLGPEHAARGSVLHPLCAASGEHGHRLLLLGSPGAVCPLVQDRLQLHGGRGNRHAGAVECKGKKHLPAVQPHEACGKFGLCDRKGMAEVQLPVHVWVGECYEKLRNVPNPVVGRGCIDLVHLLL